MKKEILIGVVTTICGLVIGYFFNEYRERPEPSLIIENVEFTKIEKKKAPEIVIEEDLMKLSEQSQWMASLDSTISLEELDELIKTDLSETVRELQNMVIVLPRIETYVVQKGNAQVSNNQYRQFLAQAASIDTITYMTMNLAGAMRRGEFNPVGLASQAQGPGAVLAGMDDSEDGDDFDRYDIMATRLFLEWHPDDLAAAVNVLQSQVPAQLVLNQSILSKLEEKCEQARKFRYQDFVNVSALVVNSGDKTVTIDQYAALHLPKLQRKFFLISDKGKGQIAVPPGEVRHLQLRSDMPLEESDAGELKMLYNTKIINCQLTARLVTQQEFTPRWVHSKLSEFSGDKTRLKKEYLEASPVQAAQ
ncbi:hypothetical protein [uncultured Pseudodesulfovibrio sp.]|uniref:hypothetical protein n=1 Tax=uncultured Pseudodesulfovibrio sp. TaxID=2035858 RepID=UPI0029C99D1E|nr:hypothetical protein [uncultured Pseudodesulfovibrio sp.]